MSKSAGRRQGERTTDEAMADAAAAAPLNGVATILEAIASERQTRRPLAGMSKVAITVAPAGDTLPAGTPLVIEPARPSWLRRLPLVGKVAWWIHALCKAPARIRDLNTFRVQAETDRRRLDEGLSRLGRELAEQHRHSMTEVARVAGLVALLAPRLDSTEQLIQDGAVARARLEAGLATLGKHVESLQSAAESHDGRIEAVAAQDERVRAELEKLRRLLAGQQADLHTVQTGLLKQGEVIDKEQAARREERAKSDQQRAALQAQRIDLDEQRQALAAQRAELEAQHAALAEQGTALKQHHVDLGEQQQALAEQQDRLHEQHTSLQEQAATVKKHEAALAAQDHAAQEYANRLHRQETALDEQRDARQASERGWQQSVQDIESRQQDADTSTRLAFQQVQARLGVPQQDGSGHDDFYSELENQFRGTFGEIKERQRRYLTVVAAARAGTPSRPVLDLGCGRGEWLQLLQEQGLVARGVDRNDTILAGCRRLGLDVEKTDLFEHLAGLAAGSMGAVTAMHVVEHLPFELILRLLGEAARVLAPGGVAIFETPNPANLLVASYSFHLDPSHLTPIPSPLLRFMAEHQGLERVEVEEMHPREEAALPGVGDPLHSFLVGPQDYVVVGWRGDQPGGMGAGESSR